MGRWFKEYWQAIPIIVALILLGIALFLNPSNFINLAWYALVAITAIYAFGTLLIGRATSKQAEETKRMIEEVRQSRLDAVRPSLSLQPSIFTEDGNFHALYLHNSGGVAKGIKIDINTTNPSSEKALFMTALNKGYMTYLHDIDVRKLRETGGLVKITVTFKDSYGQSLQENLSFDFANLKEEGRETRGQYSEPDEIQRVLERIEDHLGNIEGKIKDY